MLRWSHLNRSYSLVLHLVAPEIRELKDEGVMRCGRRVQRRGANVWDGERGSARFGVRELRR
jgi:hypothetical protein